MTNFQFPITNIKTKAHGLWPVVYGLCFVVYVLAVDLPLFALDKTPQRIISLGPAITRQISLLGAEDKIIGITEYCEMEGKEKIGTVTDASVEKILLLDPDIVLATRLTNIKTIQRLKNLNINVEIFDEVKNFGQLCDEFLKLARLVGKEEIGNEIVSNAKEKVVALSLRNKDLPRKKVIVQIGANPVWIATKDSLIDDFIRSANGINAGPAGENGLVSREYVVRQNPDIIIIIEMGILAKEEMENWMKLKTISAIQNKKIYVVDSYNICSPTPLSFAETLEEISQILHSK